MAIGFTVCPDCNLRYFTTEGHRCKNKKPKHTMSAIEVVEGNKSPVMKVSPMRDTYKYRDPDKHRAYMREYMRKRRAK